MFTKSPKYRTQYATKATLLKLFHLIKSCFMPKGKDRFQLNHFLGWKFSYRAMFMSKLEFVSISTADEFLKEAVSKRSIFISAQSFWSCQTRHNNRPILSVARNHSRC